MPGTHTTLRPRTQPCSDRPADIGRIAGERRLGKTRRHRRPDETGADRHDPSPRSVQGMAEAGRERVLARLRRSVDVVRRTRADPGDARQHHEDAVSLRAEPASHGQAGARPHRRSSPERVQRPRAGRRGPPNRVDRTLGSPRRGRRTFRPGRRSAVRGRPCRRHRRPRRPRSPSRTRRRRDRVPSGRGTARITWRSAGETNAETIAWPMSLPPPSTRTVWGCWTALFTWSSCRWFGRGQSHKVESPGLIARPQPVRVATSADRLPLLEARVPGADHLGRGGGILGEVVPAAGVEHQPVEVGARARPRPGATGGQVERQRPPGRREARAARRSRARIA